MATQAQRIWHFVRGLNPKIYMAVMSVDLPTFKENLNKAFWSKDCKTQPRDGPPGFKRTNPVSSPIQQQMKKQKTAMGQQQVLQCDFYGGSKHAMANCRKRPRLCFTYGHAARDYPNSTRPPPPPLAGAPIAAQPLRQLMPAQSRPQQL